MFDIWNEEEMLVKEQYKKDNYLVIDNEDENTKKLCVIYFSSNGLYFPNTEESFNRFVKADRYEWRKYHFTNVKREIYVRDIYKQWYIKGINSETNSVNRLIGLLKNLVPSDCEIVTVGNSAGGYMAVLVGCLLKAARVYTFSGQFCIEDIFDDENEEKNKLFKKYANKNDYIYLDLVPYMKRSETTRFYYFYPELCTEDIRQLMRVKELSNVHFFAFNDDKHGRTMYNFNLTDIFDMSEEKLILLEAAIKDRKTGRFIFSVKAVGWIKTIKYFINKFLKR